MDLFCITVCACICVAMCLCSIKACQMIIVTGFGKPINTHKGN